MSNQQKNTFVFGTSGSGKSSICNALSQKHVFLSKPSLGTPVTKSTHSFTLSKNTNLIDTPGFSKSFTTHDLVNEIVKFGGETRLFFVMCLEAGRVQYDNVETLTSVISQFKPPFQVGVVLNKLDPKEFSLLESNPENISKIQECLFKQINKNIKPDFALVKNYQEAEDKENYVMKDKDHLHDLFQLNSKIQFLPFELNLQKKLKHKIKKITNNDPRCTVLCLHVFCVLFPCFSGN